MPQGALPGEAGSAPWQPGPLPKFSPFPLEGLPWRGKSPKWFPRGPAPPAAGPCPFGHLSRASLGHLCSPWIPGANALPTPTSAQSTCSSSLGPPPG